MHLKYYVIHTISFPEKQFSKSLWESLAQKLFHATIGALLHCMAKFDCPGSNFFARPSGRGNTYMDALVRAYVRAYVRTYVRHAFETRITAHWNGISS